MNELRREFGDIDIYVFDQLLRGRIDPGMKVLDAGCGAGRNLVYLLRHGCHAYGVDTDPLAIDAVRELARDLPPENFRVEPVERMSFPTASMDAVIASAVLHFARDEIHFHSMLREMWRVLAPGGLFFSRLASTIGIEHEIVRRSGRRFLLPDGSERFLVDAHMLFTLGVELDGRMLDPLKTTLVHEQRSMTTWVLRKAG